MRKFTARRACLTAAGVFCGLLLLAWPLLALAEMTGQSVYGGPYAIGGFSESGYESLFTGSSAVTVAEGLFSIAAQAYGNTVSLTDIRPLFYFAQIACGVTCAAGALCVLLSLVWWLGFSVGKGMRVMRTVAVFFIAAALLYAAAGLIPTLALNISWIELWGGVDKSAEAAAAAMPFSSQAGWLLAAAVPSGGAFALFYVLAKKDGAPAAALRAAPALPERPSARVQEKKAPEREPERYTFERIAYLRELKALFDDGILSEQEYVKEKKKFLGE